MPTDDGTPVRSARKSSVVLPLGHLCYSLELQNASIYIKTSFCLLKFFKHHPTTLSSGLNRCKTKAVSSQPAVHQEAAGYDAQNDLHPSVFEQAGVLI